MGRAVSVGHRRARGASTSIPGGPGAAGADPAQRLRSGPAGQPVDPDRDDRSVWALLLVLRIAGRQKCERALRLVAGVEDSGRSIDARSEEHTSELQSP